MLKIDTQIVNSDNDLSTERHIFSSLNSDLSINHSVSTQTLFRFNELKKCYDYRPGVAQRVVEA